MLVLPRIRVVLGLSSMSGQDLCKLKASRCTPCCSGLAARAAPQHQHQSVCRPPALPQTLALLRSAEQAAQAAAAVAPGWGDQPYLAMTSSFVHCPLCSCAPIPVATSVSSSIYLCPQVWLHSAICFFSSSMRPLLKASSHRTCFLSSCSGDAVCRLILHFQASPQGLDGPSGSSQRLCGPAGAIGYRHLESFHGIMNWYKEKK